MLLQQPYQGMEWSVQNSFHHVLECSMTRFWTWLTYLSFLQVYMSSSGLNWKPVVSAWLKLRSPREKEVFQNLFNESFGVMYSWSTQNLCLTMKVLQANISLQVF